MTFRRAAAWVWREKAIRLIPPAMAMVRRNLCQWEEVFGIWFCPDRCLFIAFPPILGLKIDRVTIVCFYSLHFLKDSNWA